MPQDHKPQLFSTLRNYFGEIEGEREKAASATVKAADKRPDGIADPGGYQGKSSHPSAQRDVAEHLHPEQTGSRFTEHTSDVKEDVGSASIQNLPEEASSPSKGSGNQDKRQPSIGTHNAATGEDTSVERDFKGTKDDPGTTSKMKADDGEKYGSWSMQKFASHIGTLGEEILADIANGKMGKSAGIGDDVPNRTRAVGNGQGSILPPKKKKDGEGEEEEGTPEEVKAAAARGYELASVLGLQDMTPEERTAAMVETIIKEASYQGELVVDFLTGYGRTIKQAEGEHPDGGSGEDHSQPGDAASGANESGSMDGGPGGGGGGMGGDGGGGDAAGILSQLPPEVLQQLVQAVQSGQLGGMGGAGGGMGGDPSGGMGGGGAGGMMGGDPQGAMAGMAGQGGGGMGGDPSGGMGGGGGGMDPSGAAGPMGGDPAAGGQLGPDQTNDQLSGAMQDMDISPDQLEGMAGKAAADQRPYLLKIASRVRQHRRSGKYDSTKRASTKAEQTLRNEVKGYLAEVVQAVNA